MTEQPKEYIITEDELDTLDNMDQNDFVRDLLERVRSRPVIISPEGAAPEPDYSRHNPRIELRKVCEQEAHDAAIRQDEREKVLEDAEQDSATSECLQHTRRSFCKY